MRPRSISFSRAEMTEENQTVFGAILRDEIPSKRLYEDEQCIVIEDIAPKAQHHYLIIPRQYMPTLQHAQNPEDQELLGHLLLVATKIAQKQGLEGYKVLINVGEKGGQVVEHLHLHLLSGPHIELGKA